jgi:hypothetical protein
VRSPSRPVSASLAATKASAPISIPPTRQQPRRTSAAASVPTQSFHRTGLDNIDEVHAYSPTEYLSRSPEDGFPPTFSLASPLVERGEFDNHAASHLTYKPAYESPLGELTPMTATSESSLTPPSMIFSEPMTRSNTDDAICGGFDMVRLNSVSKPESGSGKDIDVDQAHSFPITSTVLAPTSSYDVSFSQFPHSLSFSSEMQPSLSSESDASTQSSSSGSVYSPRAQEHLTRSSRLLAPKSESHGSPASSMSPYMKLVPVTGEDGTVKQKAEIPRAARQEPPRKTMYCNYCDEQPQGFHGVHELERHIDRKHTMRRKVWICKEAEPNGTFLSKCKACTMGKRYGANYNAAAHLRRAHFNPPKNKRGGRGKKSEGRGGMGGGNKPPMEELKHWMVESKL